MDRGEGKTRRKRKKEHEVAARFVNGTETGGGEGPAAVSV
jgi:hypothetical protein